MSTIQIDVTDELRHRLQTQALAEGFPNVERYAEAVLRLSVGDAPIDDTTEAALLESLDDPRPSIEFTDAFRQQFTKPTQTQ